MSGIFMIAMLLLYFASITGCTFFPSLAKGCMDQRLLFQFIYGLLYIMVVLTLVFVPLLAIVYIRVTIIMPISRAIYGDGNTLDERLFAWFDRGWSNCQKLLSLLF